MIKLKKMRYIHSLRILLLAFVAACAVGASAQQTIEKPTIGGVKDKTSYKDSVIPTISFKDVNFDTYEVKLLRTRKGEKNVDVTKQFIPGISVNS
jgi:hypothetical protein